MYCKNIFEKYKDTLCFEYIECRDKKTNQVLVDGFLVGTTNFLIQCAGAFDQHNINHGYSIDIYIYQKIESKNKKPAYIYIEHIINGSLDQLNQTDIETLIETLVLHPHLIRLLARPR